MPCRSDYMEPSAAEIYTKETASLILYVRSQLPHLSAVEEIERKAKLGKIVSASKEFYGDTQLSNYLTATLCDIISELNDNEKTAVMYDGRNPQARELAAWAERHEKEDRAREELAARITAQNLTLQIEEASGEMFEQVEALLALLPELAKTAPGTRLSAIVSTIRAQ